MKKLSLLVLCLFVVAACSQNSTYTEKESPNNAYKDHRGSNKAVLGVGKTISKRKSEANATISLKGKKSLEKVITMYADVYSLSVEWDKDVNKYDEKRLKASRQTFNEAREYLEDVYGVSIVRVRDRAIKVMVPATISKIEAFNPGPNVKLSEAVNGLANVCDINLVIADYKKVLATEKITTNLQNISCMQAFEAILDPFGLSLKSRGSHYTIGGLPYKEWQLDLHEQKREESQEISYSSEFSGTTEDGGAGSVSGGKSATRQSYTRDLWTSLEEDLKELITQSCENSKDMGYSSAPAASAMDGGMDLGMPAAAPADSGTSGDKPCGYVRVNPDVGVVQMQAPRKVIERANDIILTVEDIASRRLLVEARILAVSKEREFNRSSDIGIFGNIGSTDFGFGYKPGINSSITSALADLLEPTGGAFGAENGDLDAVVRFVESYGNTYQLMKPTLEVMDRQKTTLIDGRNEKYFITSASIDSSGENPVVTTEAEERVQFVGIQFSVSAQIAESANDLHTVSLQIPITEITDYVTRETRAGANADGSPAIIPDTIPVATTRVIDQKVRIRDNEIKVIGGLTKTIAVDKESGIPLLQDVPVAGKAFSEEEVTYEDVEFVVLLQVKQLY